MVKNSKNNLKFLIIVAILLISGLQLVFCDYKALAYTTYTLSGSGTASSPYLIESLADLKGFRDNINNNRNTTKHYKLTTDIYFSNAAFTPIGTYSYKFAGTFDGDFHRLYNCNFTASNSDCGLFGYASGTIKNLFLQSGSCTLNAGYSSGALVGSVYGSAVIDSVINLGVSINANLQAATNAGGIVGCIGSSASTTIKNCENLATISNKCYSSTVCCGGIVGRDFSDSGNSSISSCGNKGTITAGTTTNTYSYAGGIIGNSSKTSISDCYNTGSIYSYAKTTKQPTENNTNEVTADDRLLLIIKSSTYSIDSEIVYAYSGGISGYSSSTINNCYNTGTIVGGQNKYTVNNISTFKSTTGSGAGSNSAFYEYTETNIKTTISYDYKLFYSGIDGNTDIARSTSCYSTFSNLKDNFSYWVYRYTRVYREITTFTRTGVTGHYTEEISKSSDSYVTSGTSKSYSSYTGNFSSHISQFSNEYAAINYTAANANRTIYNISLKVGATYNYTTGILLWKEDHSDPKSITAFTVTTIRKNGCSITSDGTLKGSSSPFKSGVWAIDSKINGGLPHFKNFYWMDNAVTPS